MKKILLFLGLGIITLSVTAQDKVINDPHAVSRPIKNFHAIDIGDGIDLYLSQSNEEAVAGRAGDGNVA